MILFSFVVPAHNEENYISACLNSIFNTESFGDDCEVIVIDNASTDRTAEIVQGEFPQARLVKEACRGLTWARQAGLLVAGGQYICCIDADNVLPASWLVRARAITARLPSSAVAFSGPYKTGLSFFAQSSYEIFSWFASLILNGTGRGGMLIGGNMVMKKEALMRVGGFHPETTLFWGEDALAARRLRKVGTIHFYRNFFVISSPRRFEQGGAVRVSIVYFMNFVWVALFGHPFSKEYKNFR